MSHRSRALIAENVHVLQGVVTTEHVYSERTSRTSSIPLREIWIRAADGRDWRVVGTAACAPVRAGHQVEAVVLGSAGDGYVLRLRNRSTGQDHVHLTMVHRIAGRTAGTAMVVGAITLPLLGLALGAIEMIEAASGWRSNHRLIEAVALVLPFAAALATSALLRPFVRARREWLLQACDLLPAP